MWSAYDGEDTLFHQFAQQARAGLSSTSSSHSSSHSNGKDDVPVVPNMPSNQNSPVAAEVTRRNQTTENSKAEKNQDLVILSSFNIRPYPF